MYFSSYIGYVLIHYNLFGLKSWKCAYLGFDQLRKWLLE